MKNKCPACGKPFTTDDPSVDLYAWLDELINTGEPIASLHEKCMVRALHNLANERRGRPAPRGRGAA